MLNWHAYPFGRVLIPFIIGIGLNCTLEWRIPFGNFILGSVLSLLILSFFKKGNFRFVLFYNVIIQIAFLILMHSDSGPGHLRKNEFHHF